ncbi:MAG TPA: alpha/beta hydrolase [Sphingomicrobium sp.]
MGSAPVDDDLDPAVRQFQQRLAADYERLSGGRAIDTVERRRIAEIVREPWTRGGPAMAQTIDAHVGDLQVPVRIHRPSADADLPVLVYAHGGGWMLFSVDTHDRLMREYAARANVAVVGVDYSRAPEARFPTAIEEVASVVRWVRSENQATRIGIAGDSAGANLAVATNLALLQRGERPTDAQLLNYGAFDPDRRPSYELYDGPSYNLTSDEMADFWVNYLPPEEHSNPLARPLLADLHGLPPTFLCIPECDILADENREMESALRAVGVEVEANSYPGATHSFLEAVSISPLADRALAEASAWLSEVLRR